MPLINPNPLNQIPILNVNYGNGAYPPPQQNQPFVFPFQEQACPPNIIPSPSYQQQNPIIPPYYNNLNPNPNYNYDPYRNDYPSNMNIPQEYNNVPQYEAYGSNPGGNLNLPPEYNQQGNPTSNYNSEVSQIDHHLPPPSMISQGIYQQYGNNNAGNYQ